MMKHMTRFANVPFVVNTRELWQKGIGCDVNFFVGCEKEHFSAHRLVMAASSEYFCTILYKEDLKNYTGLNVEIPSMSADIFEAILEFIYSTQKIDTPLISSSNFVQLYYNAKAYGISSLSKACRHYLKRMTADDCLLILDQSVLQNENELVECCLRDADMQPDQILHSEGLLDCSWSTLKILFERATFKPSTQFGVFMALLSWSIVECERRELEITPVNERRVLGELLNVIRQENLSKDEKEDIARVGLLPDGVTPSSAEPKVLDKPSTSNGFLDDLYGVHGDNVSSVPELGTFQRAKVTSSIHSEDDFCTVASTSESPKVCSQADSNKTLNERLPDLEKPSSTTWYQLKFANIEREAMDIERTKALRCEPMAASERADWSYVTETDDFAVAEIEDPPDILVHHVAKVGSRILDNIKFAKINREAIGTERAKFLRTNLVRPTAYQAQLSYEQQTEPFGVAEVIEPPKTLLYEEQFPKTTSPKLARRKQSKENLRNHMRSRTGSGSKSPKFSFSDSDRKSSTAADEKLVLEGLQNHSSKFEFPHRAVEDGTTSVNNNRGISEETRTKSSRLEAPVSNIKETKSSSQDRVRISEEAEKANNRKPALLIPEVGGTNVPSKYSDRPNKENEKTQRKLGLPAPEIERKEKSPEETRRISREAEKGASKPTFRSSDAEDRKTIVQNTKRLFEELVAKSETSAPVRERVNQLLSEPNQSQSSIKRRWSARHAHQPTLEAIAEQEENGNPKKLHSSRTWSTLPVADLVALDALKDMPQRDKHLDENETGKPAEVPTIIIEPYKGVTMRDDEKPAASDSLGSTFNEKSRHERREALKKELDQLHSLHAEAGTSLLEVEDGNASNFSRRNSMTRAEALRLASKILHTTEPGEKPSLAPLQRSVNVRRSFYVKPKAETEEAQSKHEVPSGKPMDQKTIKERLLKWCQWATKNYPVTISNFSSSWADGMAFCALAHRFASRDTSFDFSSLNPQEREKNLQLAFDVAEANGVVPLLEVEDMIIMGDKPDWKCIFVYVRSIHLHFKDRT